MELIGETSTYQFNINHYDEISRTSDPTTNLIAHKAKDEQTQVTE